MTRFLIFSSMLCFAYIVIRSMHQYDFNIQLMMLNYHIETKFSTFVTFFIFLQLLFTFLLKFVFWVLNVPAIIARIWKKRNLTILHNKLLQTIKLLLMHNREHALQVLNGLDNDFVQKNKDLRNLYMAESAQKYDEQIQHLNALIETKDCTVYASMKLANIFYTNKHYQHAEKYALQAFNINDTDPQIMLLLIHIYGHLKALKKLAFVVMKLKSIDDILLTRNASQIAQYYYQAAQEAIKSNHHSDVIRHLEEVLDIEPDNLNALRLLIGNCTTQKEKQLILKRLEHGFVIRPCFEIGKLYIQHSNNNAESYKDLAMLVDSTKYPDLFLLLQNDIALIID